MPRRATPDEIVKTGETELPIPGFFDDANEPLTIRVRKVHAGERQALLPQTPGHLYADLPEDPEARRAALIDREQRWLDSLKPEQLEARRLEAADFCCRLVSLASLDPKLTVEQARCLGDAALELADQIIEFSQNKPKAPPKE